MARRVGLTVTVLEARARNQPAPGETLHPGIEPLFRALGMGEALVAMNFHRHQGVWSAWDSALRFTAYGGDGAGPWRGFQADRSRLHALLRAAAAASGARLVRPATAEKLLRDDGRVIGAATAERTFRARWTLDATGRRAWLADALGLVPDWRSPRLQLRFGWRSPGTADPADPVIRAQPRGWSWQAPIDGRRVAWVTLRVPEREQTRPRRPTDYAWRIYESCAGPGYFLLGDAAALLDPLVARGVLQAVMSGMLAAHLVAACASGRLAEPLAAIDYRTWLRQRFESDVAALSGLYARHPFGVGLAAR
jgi:flavin-dependent dehydrogenase